MSSEIWTFELDDGEHTVEYVRGGLYQELLVEVDGLPLREMQRFDKGQQLRVLFNIGEHRCLLRCFREDWVWDFYVDGRLIY